MVELMLEGLRSGRFGEFEIHHIDARFSDTMEEIGGKGLAKVLRALRFSARAIRLRLSHGVTTFYYVPAPPKPAAMARDWLVLALCRPFFPRLILHWHAVGLGAWTLEAESRGGLKNKLAAFLNRRLLGRHHRSLVLTDWGRADAAPFAPHDVAVVGNGIADPCPDFTESLLERRRKRVADLRLAMASGGVGETFRVCFLGHCTAEKGLWEAMRGVALVADELRSRGLPLTIQLDVAGEFPTPDDRLMFDQLKRSFGDEFRLPEDWIRHSGFVGGPAKRLFLERADCLCFPTRYSAESFGLVAAEALAFGIPPVTSDWRMLPELMASVGLPVAEAGNPESLAAQLLAAIGRDDPARLREAFLSRFTAEAHLRNLATALAAPPARDSSAASATRQALP
jgi:glycosyltransferase involved in cell wall biosynthesis